MKDVFPRSMSHLDDFTFDHLAAWVAKNALGDAWSTTDLITAYVRNFPSVLDSMGWHEIFRLALRWERIQAEQGERERAARYAITGDAR